MSKSWDELKNTSDFRLQIEKYWSRTDGEIHAKNEQGTHMRVSAVTFAKILHGVDLNIASLREGIIALEDHLVRIEERLDALEKAHL
jgi:hypothetical protein